MPQPSALTTASFAARQRVRRRRAAAAQVRDFLFRQDTLEKMRVVKLLCHAVDAADIQPDAAQLRHSP